MTYDPRKWPKPAQLWGAAAFAMAALILIANASKALGVLDEYFPVFRGDLYAVQKAVADEINRKVAESEERTAEQFDRIAALLMETRIEQTRNALSASRATRLQLQDLLEGTPGNALLRNELLTKDAEIIRLEAELERAECDFDRAVLKQPRACD